MSNKYITKNTIHGSVTFEITEDGHVSNLKPLAAQNQRKFIVSSDPSAYTTGTVVETLESALRHKSAIESVTNDQYWIFELHYPENADDTAPPSAIFAYNEDKRVRII